MPRARRAVAFSRQQAVEMYAADPLASAYINYPTWTSPPAAGRGKRSTFRPNQARLRRVKARWDPHDVFHHALSVPLA